MNTAEDIENRLIHAEERIERMETRLTIATAQVDSMDVVLAKHLRASGSSSPAPDTALAAFVAAFDSFIQLQDASTKTLEAWKHVLATRNVIR